MSNKLVYVRNTVNGELALVREKILCNPHLAKHLEVVESEDGKTVVESESKAVETLDIDVDVLFDDQDDNDFENGDD